MDLILRSFSSNSSLVGAALCGVALAVSAVAYLRSSSRVAPRRDLAVVISGCDSGFGQGVTNILAAAGYTVFAGCFTAEGVSSWSKTEGVHAFQLDVTNTASVAAASVRVSKWMQASPDRGVHALVNNAGVGASGLVECVGAAGGCGGGSQGVGCAGEDECFLLNPHKIQRCCAASEVATSVPPAHG